jgi:hypothetical protein
MRKLTQVLAMLLVTIPGTAAMAQPPPHADHTAPHTPQSRVGMVSDEVVRSLLQSHGFENVERLRLDGNRYRAEATKAGNRVEIEIDAVSGRLLKP